MSNNKNLMEAVLARLKSLIVMMESGEVEQLGKLVNMAVEVSNQLVRIENGECNYVAPNESDDESDDDGEENQEEVEED